MSEIARHGGAAVRAVLRRPLSRSSWAEPLYIVAVAPLAFLGFGLVPLLFLSVFASLTLVGLPLMALVLIFSMRTGSLHRRLVTTVLHVRIDSVSPRPWGRGLFGWLGSVLGDPRRWRAWLYLIWKLPYSFACAYALFFTWIYAFLAVTYPLLRPLFWPPETSPSGIRARGISIGHYYLFSWPQSLLVGLIGVGWLVASAWVVHWLVLADLWVMRRLLGDPASQRMRELEGARSFAMDDAATTLRRIERDLHDGAQARLVAVALAVGMARDTLETGSPDVEKTRELLESAHIRAKEAIAELRDLARGIHPAVLDAGLEAALATLVSTSSIPVAVSFTLADRPSPAIETIAYFCGAELLTNVAKHSAATHVYLDVSRHADQLRLRVIDDGRGGAHLDRGTGLRGLTERVRSVDGKLDLSSPQGGPTVVTVDLPFQA